VLNRRREKSGTLHIAAGEGYAPTWTPRHPSRLLVLGLVDEYTKTPVSTLVGVGVSLLVQLGLGRVEELAHELGVGHTAVCLESSAFSKTLACRAMRTHLKALADVNGHWSPQVDVDRPVPTVQQRPPFKSLTRRHKNRPCELERRFVQALHGLCVACHSACKVSTLIRLYEWESGKKSARNHGHICCKCNTRLQRQAGKACFVCVWEGGTSRRRAPQVGAPPVTFRVEETKKKFFFPGSGESFNPLRLFLPLNEKI